MLKSLRAILLLIMFANTALGQSNEGTSFWLGFMHHRDVGLNKRVIMITSKYDTRGTVSVPNRDYTEEFKVKANDVVVIELPGYTEITSSEEVEITGIHVTSQLPISLYMHHYFGLRSEAALVLPEESIGNEYFVMAYAGVLNNGADYPSEFLIVAPQDETKVTITPSVETLAGGLANVPIEVVLNKGEVFQVQGRRHSLDLTGSHIISDKPVALFGGSRWTEVPTGCGYRDNLVEQMYSVDTWGKQFVGVPATKVLFSKFRIMASVDNTLLKRITGTSILEYTLQRGEFVEFDTNLPFYLDASEPVLPAQYLVGTICSGYQFGDPAMLLLNSVEQTRDTVTLFNSKLENISENYINVIMYSDDVEFVTVDGEPISSEATVYTVGENDEFSFATVDVRAGPHTIISNGCGIIASAYGYGEAESYAYSGGASFRKVNFNRLPEGGCLNDTIFFDSQLNPNRYSFIWDLGDGTKTDLPYFEHKYPDLGVYNLSVIIEDNCLGVVDTFYRDMIITLRQAVMVSDDVEICAGDYFSLSASDLADADYEWTGPLGYFGEGQVQEFNEPKAENSGTYSAVGIISGCATFPQNVEVTVFHLPKPIIGQDTFFCPKEETLDLMVQEFVSYEWSTASFDQQITINQGGVYTVEVSDENDCINTDSIMVAELCPTEVYIPNAFSPNGDDVNDDYIITVLDGNNPLLTIFDRWGNVMIRTSQIEEGWNGEVNGTPAAVGVYIYIFEVEGIDENGDLRSFQFSGDLTLIR